MRRLSIRTNEGGYILAATLILLALVALIAARLAQRVDLLREQSSNLVDIAQALTDASSARARAIYDISTGRITRAGFVLANGKYLPVDGRDLALSAEGLSKARVSIQDERGLLSLDNPDRPALSHLLLQEGVPQDSVDHLLDCLEDYTDTDSLRRLNGAEAPDYEALGLPPPRNDWLESPQELRQIIGWRDYPDATDRLMPLLSSRRDGFYNANAAPRAVLMARFPRAPASQIDAFLARRTVRPFGDAIEARSVSGLPFSTDLDLFYPSDQYRLTVHSPGIAVGVEYTVRLTPGGAKRPWEFLDARTVYLGDQVAAGGGNDAAANSNEPPVTPDEAQRPEAF